MSKLRKMMLGDDWVMVREFFVVKNFREYYITNRYPKESRLQEAVVYGDDTELGDVDMEEVRPYIITRTEDLENISPAPGWSWGS